MSLWRKRNVHHNGQNQPKWFNMTALANNDLSIKSEDLSIKSEKAMREVQRLGQEIEQEPVGQLLEDAFGRGQVMWFNKPKDESMLYTTPQQRTWVGLTEDERYKLWLTTPSETEDRFAFAKAIEQALKERNT